MLQKIKQLITVAAFGLLVLAPLAVPATAGAQDINKNLRCGANFDASLRGCNPDVDDSAGNVDDLITDIVNIISLLVGVVAVIMIIIGGFRYITSGGNDSSVAGAKNTILYAIIGLVIVALAQFIVRFVLARVTD
ncbi:MAG: pilin [bacterium]|nr:pilin [bacterium]